jgi:hypothetical protein
MEKQTAVDWLEKELIKRFNRSQMHYTNSEWCFDMIKKLSEQAKEMHKQEIVEFTENYILECVTCSYDGVPNPLKEAEEYYNETF